MSSDPNTTSSTFGVTEGFCSVFNAGDTVAPFREPASGAIDSKRTRRIVVHMLVGSTSDVLRFGVASAKHNATRRHVLGDLSRVLDTYLTPRNNIYRLRRRKL
jgi:hypothetical protein